MHIITICKTNKHIHKIFLLVKTKNILMKPVSNTMNLIQFNSPGKYIILHVYFDQSCKLEQNTLYAKKKKDFQYVNVFYT